MANEEDDTAGAPPEPSTPRQVLLDDAYLTKLTDFINRKAVSPIDACPVCGDRLNFVNEHVFAVQTINEPPSAGWSSDANGRYRLSELWVHSIFQ